MGAKTFLWLELENYQWLFHVCSKKNIKAFFIACKLSVKRVVVCTVTNDP